MSVHQTDDTKVIIKDIDNIGLEKQTGFTNGQKVSLRITEKTGMGFTALINGIQNGVLYKNEIFQPLEIGQTIEGFIKKIRDDKKIDLCLQEPGYKAINPLSSKIMETLGQHSGFLAVTDKSSPREIACLFGISKKTFKKVIGNLYKNRLIWIEKDGIRLRGKNKQNPGRHRCPTS